MAAYKRSMAKRVPFREVAVGGDGVVALVLGDGNGIAECTGLVVDLNPLLKELLQRKSFFFFPFLSSTSFT